MKTKSLNILLILVAGALIAGTVQAAPQVTRKRVRRPSRHSSPHGRREQKGMRHYVAEQGTSYTVVNGCAVPVPAQVIYTTPTPVLVGPTIVTTTTPYSQSVYYPATWNYYAPPPPNPPPPIIYPACVRPGLTINLSF